jgi:hypothetical protein
MKNRIDDFFKELSQNCHNMAKVPQGAKPGNNEFSITHDWKIIIPSPCLLQIKEAACDLKEFFKNTFNISIAIIENNSSPEFRHAKSILLTLSEDTSACAESYTINCTPDTIAIEGADGSGIMYGVYYLQDLMKFRKAPILSIGITKRKPLLATRIFRSPMAFYYSEELYGLKQAYPDAYLRKLAGHGFNGIWLRGILRDLVKSSIFPEFGSRSNELQSHLNNLIHRCTKFGIKVYLYLTEPLGIDLDDPFCQNHPEMLGAFNDYQQMYALCTGNKEVREYLDKGFYSLFSNAPGLGGVILITASEHVTHCYSHVNTRNNRKVTCKHCENHSPAEVISEVITLINDGIKRADKHAKVIAWNWSWSMHYDDPQSEIIQKLPEDVIVMADFERGGIKQTDGFSHLVDEYSLTYVGPSERFKGTAQATLAGNHKMFAKLQLGVTHEMPTVPYFPVLDKIANKMKGVNKLGCSGMMGCWNFGNILSRNTEVAHWYSWHPVPENTNSLLLKIAARDFGEQASEIIVKAWEAFSLASDHFPFDNKLVYGGPMSYGAAYPLFFQKENKPMPIVWLLPKEMEYNISFECMKKTEFGDLYENFTSALGVERNIECFKRLCRDWTDGISLLTKAFKLVPEYLANNLEREYNVCKMIHCQFQSTLNFIEFTYLRNILYENNEIEQRHSLLQKMLKIAESELQNSLTAKELSENDISLGFHGEAFGYFYTPEKINTKIEKVRHIIDVEIPDYIKNKP